MARGLGGLGTLAHGEAGAPSAAPGVPAASPPPALPPPAALCGGATASGSHARPRTSFYVDCRLFKVSPWHAEWARHTVVVPERTTLAGAAGKLPALPGSEPVRGENDVQHQCAQLQGLFAQRQLSPLSVFELARGRTTLHNDRARDFYILHSASRNWFKCSIDTNKELHCAVYRPVDGGSCKVASKWPLRKCNFNRHTFATQCIDKVGKILPFQECIYVGHAMESHPFDVMGKPVPYGVYILSGPPPQAVAATPPFPGAPRAGGPTAPAASPAQRRRRARVGPAHTAGGGAPGGGALGGGRGRVPLGRLDPAPPAGGPAPRGRPASRGGEFL